MRAAYEPEQPGSLVRTPHFANPTYRKPSAAAGKVNVAGRMVVLLPIDRPYAMLPDG